MAGIRQDGEPALREWAERLTASSQLQNSSRSPTMIGAGQAMCAKVYGRAVVQRGNIWRMHSRQ